MKSIDLAIEKKDLTIFYQPQLSIDSESLLGAEVLMRWESDKYDSVSPELFIPLMEDTGLMVETTEWLLKETLARWKLLISQNKIHKDATLSVNISAKSLQDRNFLGFLAEIFDQTKFPRENLIFDVTESVMINNTDVATETLLEVRKLGSKV